MMMLAAAAVSCSKVEADKPENEVSGLPQHARMEIKVMSSNVRNGSEDSGIQLWSYRKNAYLSMLSDVQPDIIGLQEAKKHTLADLAIASEYEIYNVYEYDGSNPTVTNDHLPVNAIMYRKSLFDRLDSGVFYYNEEDHRMPVHNPCGASGWQVRGCVWVKLKVKATGRLVYFFDTHYTHDPDILDADGNKIFNIEPRRKASEILVEEIEGMTGGSGAAVFVTGDLNCALTDGATRNGARSLEPLTEYMWSAREDTGYSDGAISFNGFDPSYNKATGNIDHIFYRGAEALEFRTVNGHDYGVYFISDHYPVTCTFVL